MSILSDDIRFGWRQLRKRPAFTALASISMALGIGANSAIFSLVDTVLLRPLPVRAPDQLFQIYGAQHKDADISLQSYLNYKDYRDRNTVLSGITYRIAVAKPERGQPNERIWDYLVSGNYFDVLGVQPVLGRGFLAKKTGLPARARSRFSVHPLAKTFRRRSGYRVDRGIWSQPLAHLVSLRRERLRSLNLYLRRSTSRSSPAFCRRTVRHASIS